jgi:cell division topological specificity factor
MAMDLFGFLRKQQPPSKVVAKERLKLVLIHDRVDSSSSMLEMLRNDIMKVILKYMDIDEEELDLQISQTDADDYGRRVPVLYANIPIKNLRRSSS